MSDRPLPHWPRRMSAFLAAGYLDISETKFLADVKAGRYPQPIHDGRRVLWDRHALDEAVNLQFGAAANEQVSLFIRRLREVQR
jgi:hypothetical protein